MKPVLLALISMVGISVCNVMLELKFSKYNSLTIMLCYSPILCILTVLARHFTKTADPSFDFPQGSMLALALSIGFIFAISDYCYISAYTSGGNLLTVTSMMLMVPIFASLIKFLIASKIPNPWQIAGYGVAVIAVMLLAKGSSASSSQ